MDDQDEDGCTARLVRYVRTARDNWCKFTISYIYIEVCRIIHVLACRVPTMFSLRACGEDAAFSRRRAINRLYVGENREHEPGYRFL